MGLPEDDDIYAQIDALIADVGEAAGGVEPDPDEQRRRDEERKVRLGALGSDLLRKAKDNLKLRQTIEERWYDAVRQYNGVYPPGTFDESENEHDSRVYAPLTRRLVNLCEARLVDLIFASETRNFVTEPTPVPDLDQASGLASRLPPEQQVGDTTAGALASSIKAVQEEAKTRADGMQREIDDQLAEAHWPRHGRRAIHEALLFGTGVLKGPVPHIRTSKRWVLDQVTGEYTMQVEEVIKPAVEFVSVWNFIPDMSATHMSEAEFVFERIFLTRAELVALAETMPDVDVDAVLTLAKATPTNNKDNHRERLRALAGTSGAADPRYEIWAYTGPVSAADLVACGCPYIHEDDETIIHQGCVWFAEDGTVLKATLAPTDGDHATYHVFCWQEDEASVFGYGLPYETADQQEGANSSLRAVHDNMGLIVKPQVIWDDTAIEPYDGSGSIHAGKQWRMIKAGTRIDEVLRFQNIESRLKELLEVFTLNKTLIEEIGTLPAFLQGQDHPGKMQSATEASIAWTAANLWVRRCLRSWDDGIIEPMLTGFWNWNMQWSDKAEIKGDMRVRAMGVAYIAELEGQSNRLQSLHMAAEKLGVPLATKYALLRQLSRSLKLDPDTWLPSEAEVRKMREEENKNPRQDPETMRAQIDAENNKMDHDLGVQTLAVKREEIADRRAEREDRMNLELTQAATEQQISQQDSRRKYGFDMAKERLHVLDNQAQREHDAQALNAEMEFAARTGSGV